MRKGRLFSLPFLELPRFQGNSDYLHIEACNRGVEVCTDHFLPVAGHDALTWGEVLLTVDNGCEDEWHVWSVDITALKEGRTLKTNKDLVYWEVWVNEY